jgi:hypothetical protein
VTPALALLGLGVALAEPGVAIPDAAAGWGARLDRTYAHYKEVKPSFMAAAPAGLPCPDPRSGAPTALRRPGMEAARAKWEADPKAALQSCLDLGFDSWMLRMDLEPRDQRAFARFWMRVIELPEGRSAEDTLAAWLDLGVLASKDVQALVPVDRYLLDLHLPCAADGLLDFEVADLLDSFTEAPALPMPGVVAVSRCGQRYFEGRTRAQVAERGRRQTELWGLPFPETRQRLRASE